MHMEKERIDEIRKLGDKLAVYVKEQDDKRFFLNFYKVQRYDDFRTLLMRANNRYVRAGRAPLVEFNPYLIVFEEGDGVMRLDWKLARDLVLIRMIEQLYQGHWFTNNPDALPDEKEIGSDLAESEQ
jgi:CRISPR-associated protein Cst1